MRGAPPHAAKASTVGLDAGRTRQKKRKDKRMILKDKVALITGSARGIGRAIALALAKAGAKIVISDIDEAGCQATAEEIKKLGVEAIGIKFDVSKYEEAEKTVETIIAKFGRIDILINNAGITRDNLMMRLKPEDWALVINVNLTGTFNCAKAVSRPMLKTGGKIINISSIVGVYGNAGQANYSASKAGVIGLTKTLAKELASRNITVNAIAPGFIKTEMTAKLTEEMRAALTERIPLKKLGEPEDVANMCVFLASPAADYVTGQVIGVDGGLVVG